jgi:hypothetical protein
MSEYTPTQAYGGANNSPLHTFQAAVTSPGKLIKNRHVPHCHGMVSSSVMTDQTSHYPGTTLNFNHVFHKNDESTFYEGILSFQYSSS